MEDEAIHIVMEYAEQGDLYKVSLKITFYENLDVKRLKDEEKVFF
jgi:hypothetical protein